MAIPTLAQVFGASAQQNEGALTISKADLVATGLTINANNTAQALFVAILLKAANYLSTTNQTSVNTDIQITIADSGFPTVTSRNNANYRQITYNINLQTLDTGFTIDPDNYL
jgi:hypothetical protein